MVDFAVVERARAKGSLGGVRDEVVQEFLGVVVRAFAEVPESFSHGAVVVEGRCGVRAAEVLAVSAFTFDVGRYPTAFGLNPGAMGGVPEDLLTVLSGGAGSFERAAVVAQFSAGDRSVGMDVFWDGDAASWEVTAESWEQVAARLDPTR